MHVSEALGVNHFQGVDNFVDEILMCRNWRSLAVGIGLGSAAILAEAKLAVVKS